MWIQSLSLIVRTVSVDVNEATLKKTSGYKDVALLIPVVVCTKALQAFKKKKNGYIQPIES